MYSNTFSSGLTTIIAAPLLLILEDLSKNSSQVGIIGECIVRASSLAGKVIIASGDSKTSFGSLNEQSSMKFGYLQKPFDNLKSTQSWICSSMS